MSEKEITRLLALSVELNDQILKNAGLAKFIDLSTGTGMSHLGWSAFRGEVRKVLEPRAAEMNRRAPAWQDIDTAPKERRAILVWCQDNQCCFTAMWREAERRWTHFWSAEPFPDSLPPTHWQPLPEPPK